VECAGPVQLIAKGSVLQGVGCYIRTCHWFKEEYVAKTDELYANAITLAKEFDDNFLELASVLRRLQENDPEKFKDFVKASGMGLRKAYYLVQVDKVFKPFHVPKKRLRELGWTKLMVLSKHVKKTNYLELLDFAEKHTVKELEAYVKGGKVEDNAHSVLMYFNDQDYDELVDALVAHGAVRQGRGLVNKEQALISLIKSKKKNPF
jgi:hypothetical protein